MQCVHGKGWIMQCCCDLGFNCQRGGYRKGERGAVRGGANSDQWPRTGQAECILMVEWIDLNSRKLYLILGIPDYQVSCTEEWGIDRTSHM